MEALSNMVLVRTVDKFLCTFYFYEIWFFDVITRERGPPFLMLHLFILGLSNSALGQRRFLVVVTFRLGVVFFLDWLGVILNYCKVMVDRGRGYRLSMGDVTRIIL